MRVFGGLLCALSVLSAAGVQVRFDPGNPEVGPFPSDALTVADPLQKTGRRVNLPAGFATAGDLQILNSYDGFAPQGRARIRFSGAINPETLRDGVFFVSLEAAPSGEFQLWPAGHLMRINEVVWDPATNTAYARPDGPLDQSRRHAVIVTTAVKDRVGDPVGFSPQYTECATGQIRNSEVCDSLQSALTIARTAVTDQIVGASVYTTLSATAFMEAARRGLAGSDPGFERAGQRAVVDAASIKTITLRTQVRTSGDKFSDSVLPVSGTLFTAAGVGRIAFGSFKSPRFLGRQIPAMPGIPTGATTLTSPETDVIPFHVWLPNRPAPAGGYPVILAGHGLGDDRFGMPSALAIGLCQQGYAVAAFNAFGHGFGPEGTVRFELAAGDTLEFPYGGRGADVFGTGQIGASDGAALVAPNGGSIFFRDSTRQTALDWMQFVRAVQRGMDLDGAGRSTLDGSRLYYFGQSLGAFYGSIVTAVEPSISSSTLNVGGDSTVHAGVISPNFRPLMQRYLATYGLLNRGQDFDANLPFRYEPARVNDVPGAIAIQNQIDVLSWIDAPGAAGNYAPHFKSATLTGVPMKRVLFQYVTGDRTVPNPVNVALVLAANARETTSVFRFDLVKAQIPDAPADPHGYVALGLLGSTQYAAIALSHQTQAGQWFSGTDEAVPDANFLARLLLGRDAFETPAVLVDSLGY